jgi:hypothetical protein
MSLTASVASDNLIELTLADGNNIVREFKTADTWDDLKEGLISLCELWKESEAERLAEKAHAAITKSTESN